MRQLDAGDSPVILNRDTFMYEDTYRHAEDDETRLSRLATASSRVSLYQDILQLNLAIAPPERFEQRVNRDISRNAHADGTDSVRGLTYVDEFLHGVVPAAARLTREIVSSDLDDQVKLQRAAFIGGVLVAESQTFSQANNRTARALLGRILFGGIDGIERGYNALIDFWPNESIESLILEQGVQRVLSPGGNRILPGFRRVDVTTRDGLQAMQKHWAVERFVFGTTTTPHLSDAEYNRSEWDSTFRKQLGESRLGYKITRIMFQREYGPAIWYAVMGDQQDHRALTIEHANRMVDIERKLMINRVKMLLNGVAAGGVFAEIDRNNQLQTRHWLPSITWAN